MQLLTKQGERIKWNARSTPHVMLTHLFAVLAALPLIRTQQIPSFLKVCHRNDPEINECVKTAVEVLRDRMPQGIPEFGIPPCEPLYIPEVLVSQGKGAVSVSSSYTNVKVYGPSQFVLHSVKVDLPRDRVKFKLSLPYLHMSSDYKMEGRILMLPISGSGYSEGNYTDIEATCTMIGERLNRNGDIYFNIKSFLVDFNIGHAKVLLDDLFGGDNELGGAMNMFLNDNWRNVATEIKPVLEETIGALFKKFANKIFHKYPMDQLLPP